MHKLSTSFVLGYHGCDRTVGEAILAGEAFRPSENEYDWLGGGVYFWEANPQRALDFVQEVNARRTGAGAPSIDPMVVGAVIDLGLCLDLMTTGGLKSLAAVYRGFKSVVETAGVPMPRNHGGPDQLLRKLDCAVINFLHTARIEAGQPAVDTVRGVFIEGERIYEDAGFREKTHIQICVRNLDCIKGVFRVSPSALAS